MGAAIARRSLRLHEWDVAAGAQILAWVAYPHRPEHGVKLLENWFWARRVFRKEAIPELPFPLKKRNRLEAQLRQFEHNFLNGIRAGLWFQRHCFAKVPGEGPLASTIRCWGASIRRLALSQSDRRGTAPANEIRRIWSQRKPVLHLAQAAGEMIAELHHEEGRRCFNLERTVFQPNWVNRTLERSEGLAQLAAKLDAFPLGGFYRFHRDSF